MSASDYQVGGSHYQRMAIQPEVFVRESHMEYHEAAVVKYVTRWRDKGGLNDLRKARHFIQFRRDNPDWVPLLARVWPIYCQSGAKLKSALRPIRGLEAFEYSAANKLPAMERNIIEHIATWNLTGNRMHLVAADKWLEELIESELAGGEG